MSQSKFGTHCLSRRQIGEQAIASPRGCNHPLTNEARITRTMQRISAPNAGLQGTPDGLALIGPNV